MNTNDPMNEQIRRQVAASQARAFLAIRASGDPRCELLISRLSQRTGIEPIRALAQIIALAYTLH